MAQQQQHDHTRNPIRLDVLPSGQVQLSFAGIQATRYDSWRHYFAAGISAYADADLIRVTAARAATDHTRTASTQPYRTTKAAQLVARQLRDEPVTPHPPTALVRVYANDGRTSTLHPLRDVLSRRTIATLAAIEEGGRQ